ncbi:3-oxoacyl-ACP synthase [Mucilaginibacter ginkgonis]|uniref:3-oxoacyl-ACP synthase n=1 Tax=Mucilaginibacter ginkgonis TaxID=2682091 RepID=A0A6I4IN62_9SPHI|nr:3-oxoacyl-ACP synthase [Mucilaginibacter ginkgonis]QQL49380.1 3-oxoacyl-ACP synthase [Mucilaginibacter ginkgonis]
MNELKQQLYNYCRSYAQNRVDILTDAIESARQSAAEDTKSSAGDKYETGREMLQQETNRNTTLLNEANKLLVVLNRISTTGISKTADGGSIVVTDNGNFYLAVSAGTAIVAGTSYFTVSQASPIGQKLTGKKPGDTFEMNGKIYKVKEVQ